MRKKKTASNQTRSARQSSENSVGQSERIQLEQKRSQHHQRSELEHRKMDGKPESEDRGEDELSPVPYRYQEEVQARFEPSIPFGDGQLPTVDLSHRVGGLDSHPSMLHGFGILVRMEQE
jgi:hypothetical protein